MGYLVKLYIRVAFLQSGPQDVPGHPFVLLLSLLGMLLTYVIASLSYFSVGEELARGVLDTAYLAAFTYIVLTLRDHKARFRQTFSALCGVSAILNLCFWPVLTLSSGAELGATSATLLGLTIYTFYVWSIAVGGHIFRHALNLGWPGGIGVALLNLFIGIAIINAAFPPQGGT